MSTWEQRMSERAAARAAVAEAEEIVRQAAEPDTPDGWPGHEGHHWHNRFWGRNCSCGGITGVSCYILPDDWLSDPDAQSRWEDENRCPQCGERGVCT